MGRFIDIDDLQIEVVRNRRQRTLRLKINPKTGQPQVSIPWLCPIFMAKSFVQKHLIETSRYENSSFVFDPTQRLLTNLMTQAAISLTEKETAFLAFLVCAKDHKATKEEILENVWQYSPEAETHTIESHLYGLKQKLGTHADKLIRVQDGVFYLI